VRKSAKNILLICFMLTSVLGNAQPEEYVNSIGMKFVLIHPGKMIVGKFQPPYPVADDTVKNANRPLNMWMGDGRQYSDTEFKLARDLATKDALPGFEVTISEFYYIGVFEVTQAQWKKVMGSNPSAFHRDSLAGDFPVENISWRDAQKFIAKLNKLEKRNTYRLPTEFEWEYAARAGAVDEILWSDTQQQAQLGTKTTQRTGHKKPNAWGLHDMLGNVWEWVQDIYNEKIFADPVPPRKGDQHVLKGASFTGDVKNATYMTHAAGPANGWDVGFRIVMTVDKNMKP
jgi:formylglycine-generating enzyme required for sulfatase activity